MKLADEKCPICGQPLVKTKKFVYCISFKCSYAKPIEKDDNNE